MAFGFGKWCHTLRCWLWMTKQVPGGSAHLPVCVCVSPAHIPLVPVGVSPLASPAAGHGQGNIPSRWDLLLLLLLWFLLSHQGLCSAEAALTHAYPSLLPLAVLAGSVLQPCGFCDTVCPQMCVLHSI